MTAQQITQQAVTYAADIANGLAVAVTSMNNLPPQIASMVKTWAADAEAAATQLYATMTQAAAQPIVQRILADVQSVLQSVQSFVGGNPQVSAILQDIQIVLPLLAALVGLMVPAPSANLAARPPQAAAAELHALRRVSL